MLKGETQIYSYTFHLVNSWSKPLDVLCTHNDSWFTTRFIKENRAIVCLMSLTKFYNVLLIIYIIIYIILFYIEEFFCKFSF